MDGDMRRGFANAAAMSTLKFMEIGMNQATVGAAIGTYKGNQAVAVGVQTAPTENVRVHANVSIAPSREQVDTMAGIGADRKSTRLNSSHANISYAVFCLKKK